MRCLLTRDDKGNRKGEILAYTKENGVMTRKRKSFTLRLTRLTREYFDASWEGRGELDGNSFCCSGIREFLIGEFNDIPVDDIKNLWLTFFTGYGSSRVSIKVEAAIDVGFSGNDLIEYPKLIFPNTKIDEESLDDIFRPYMGKKLYLEVWYE
jgi:hypothetical protein